MYRLSFYVPVEDAEKVKSAVFLTGAGRIGNYDHCSWETEGIGQFRPLAGSTPAIGAQGVIERVRELKVELVCSENCIEDAVSALKVAHPYEEPAYEVYRMEDI